MTISKDAPLALADSVGETTKLGLHNGQMPTELQRGKNIKMEGMTVKNHLKRNKAI